MTATLKDLEIGTQIYYTGDMANCSDWGKVTSVHSENLETVEVKFEGRKRTTILYANHIGLVYRGHCNPRFVTKKAYQEYFKS